MRQQLKHLENRTHRDDSRRTMKSQLIAIVAGVVLVGCGPESNFPEALNKHGVIYHACCEADTCCGMDNCCDLKEKKSGEACKNSNCVKISNEKKGKAAKLKAEGN